MTLPIRDVRFDFAGDDVPFLWNPANPAFSVQANAVSLIAISFEKFIVAAVSEALPLIADPVVRAEAHSFLDQEAQHASRHREHVHALTRRWPGMVDVLSGAIGCFDELTEKASLRFRLAYIADLEATFTPWFTMLLDHDEQLFGTGDDRVASLFLWHFVEEVEHRSSGLEIYAALVPSRWYRMLVLPLVVRHLNRLLTVITEGFNAAVPEADRGVDARVLLPRASIEEALGRLPLVGRRFQDAMVVPDCYVGVPGPARKAAAKGVLFSQTPYHDPGAEAVPAFAERWFARYDAGADVGHWYGSLRAGAE
jgi:predicted metal-dependent hydrolase